MAERENTGFRKAFVAGHPVTHSRSPKIHGHWLQNLGLAGSYEAVDVAPGQVAAHLQRVRSGEFAGGNITVPLKEEAFAAVDRLTGVATAIGAVNTVWMEQGALWGDNTDISGFAANLDARALNWRNAETAFVLGAGGAARAVLMALVEAGVPRITNFNRTLSKAEELAESFQTAKSRIKAAPLGPQGVSAAGADLLINTTSVGMAGKGGGALADFSQARHGAIATDIVYVPLMTPFLAAAAKSGLVTVDGLGMLLHQAAPGFERWFGVRPLVTPALRALIEADIAPKADAGP
jgi:shikimate dehydrogenase